MTVWLNFPEHQPKKQGRYLVQDWTGHVTVARWVEYGWSLFKPAAIVRFGEFQEPPSLSPGEQEKREMLLEMCEDEAERNMRKLLGVTLPKHLRKYD
jgi:hypothetical protein